MKLPPEKPDCPSELEMELYRQAAEEYRSEDRNTWQTFAVMLAINGGLVSFLEKSPKITATTWLAATIGLCSCLGGVLIIARTRVYQRYRSLVARNLEARIGLFHYSVTNIEDAIRAYEPLARFRWYERVSGRHTMMAILILVALAWVAMATFSSL